MSDRGYHPTEIDRLRMEFKGQDPYRNLSLRLVDRSLVLEGQQFDPGVMLHCNACDTDDNVELPISTPVHWFRVKYAEHLRVVHGISPNDTKDWA